MLRATVQQVNQLELKSLARQHFEYIQLDGNKQIMQLLPETIQLLFM